MNVPLIAMFVGGMVTMYVLIMLIPGLLPKSFYSVVLEKLKRERREAEKAKKEHMDRMMAEAHASQAETYSAAITRNDIERDFTQSVVQHVRDQVEDVRRYGYVRHLLQVIYLNWDKNKAPLWRDPKLVAHVHKIYQECPEIIYFLEDGSIGDFFEILFVAEKGCPEEGVEDAPLLTVEEFHARFIQDARAFFEAQGKPENREKMDKIADQTLDRLERGIKKLHDARAARDAARRAALEAQQAAAAQNA
jgi:hypothetical protein